MWPNGILIFSVVCYGLSQANVQLPPGFRVCKRKDPDIDKCFVEAANEDYNLVKDGYPALGLPSLRKLRAPQLKHTVGNEALGISFKIELNDCYLTHTFDKFTNAHLDFDKQTLDFEVSFKDFTWHAQHNTTGRFLVGNFKGAGNLEAIMYDLLCQGHSELRKKVQDGETYWNVDELQLKLHPKRMVVKADNILANKQANDALLKVMNDNWKIVFEPLFPQIEKAVAPVLQEVQNSVCRKIPDKQLFPDN